MSRKILITLAIVLISVSFFNFSTKNSYYNRGLIEKENGNWSNALNIWLQGRNELMNTGESDPRIAVAVMELVTEKDLKHFYKTASQMYMDCLTVENLRDYPDVFADEVERIMPLVKGYNDKKIEKEWKKLVFQRDKEIIYRLKGLWLNLDPTPSSPVNERLMEHWERIAYSRNFFKKNKKTVYRTDERALIYLKYGAPDRKKAGTYFYTTNERGTFYQDIIDYEVWVYSRFNPYEAAIFVFGSHKGHPFELKQSIEDFVPLRVSEAPLVKLYKRIIALDVVFWRRVLGFELGTGIRKTQMISLDHADPVKYDLPLEISKFEDIINPISIISSQTRILDELDNPKLKIAAMSYPSNLVENYKLENKLIVWDKEYNEIDRINDIPPLKMENTSIFTFDHTDSSFNYMLAADAYKLSENPGNDFYVGKKRLNSKSPLDSNPANLELSDLVLGIEIPEQISKEILPFPVLPSEKVFAGDNLKVYFEIYHLMRNPNGNSKYKVTYQITKKGNKGFLGYMTFRNRDSIKASETSVIDSRDIRTKENITFDVSDLKKGDYVFSVSVTDMNSNRMKIRTEEFRIDELKIKK